MKILAPLRQDTIVFVLVQILVEEVIPEQEVCYMQAKVKQTSSSQIILYFCYIHSLQFKLESHALFGSRPEFDQSELVF